MKRFNKTSGSCEDKQNNNHCFFYLTHKFVEEDGDNIDLYTFCDI